MKVFGVEIRLAKRKRPLSGAAAASAALKAAGKNGKVSGPRGKSRRYGASNASGAPLSRREKQLREAELDLKLQEKMVDIAIKQEELHARRNGLSSKDPATLLRENIKAFKEMREVFDEMGGGAAEDDSFRGILKAAIKPFAEKAGEAAGPYIAQIAQQGATQVQQIAPPGAPVVHQPPQIAAPTETPQPQGESVDFRSQFIIAQLGNKTPEQAARWLVAQQNQDAQAIVVALIQTPDDQIPALIGQIRSALPGLAAWLDQRLPLLIEVAHVLRAMNARYVTQPGQAMASGDPL